MRRSGRIPGWAGLAIIAAWAAIAVGAPLLAPHPAGAMIRAGMMSPMSAGAPFGTDYLGRDMLSRVIYSTRYSLGAPLLASLIASGTGTALGILAAVRGGWTDGAISRVADTFISIPHLMFALVIVAALGSSLPVLVGLLEHFPITPIRNRFPRHGLM